MPKERKPIITLQMPMSARLMAEVLKGVAYVYPQASIEIEQVWGRCLEVHLTQAPAKEDATDDASA
jgi:hypothetical protein